MDFWFLCHLCSTHPIVYSWVRLARPICLSSLPPFWFFVQELLSVHRKWEHSPDLISLIFLTKQNQFAVYLHLYPSIKSLSSYLQLSWWVNYHCSFFLLSLSPSTNPVSKAHSINFYLYFQIKPFVFNLINVGLRNNISLCYVPNIYLYFKIPTLPHSPLEVQYHQVGWWKPLQALVTSIQCLTIQTASWKHQKSERQVFQESI